jgi:hypothetical protein
MILYTLTLACLCEVVLTSTRPATPDTVVIEVGDAPSTSFGPLTTNFVSFSAEVMDAPLFFGSASSPNLSFRNLMRVLQRVSRGRGPSIRIGGNSADLSVFLESGPLPPNATYAITTADLLSYAAALPTWDGYAVLDTNFFYANSTRWATAHAAAVTASIGWGRIEGVEIGNEVELFKSNGFRPPDWGPDAYDTEFAQHVAALQDAGMPHGLIQGAVFCCNDAAFDAYFPTLANEWAGRGALAALSYHHYAVGGCGGKRVTLPELLADAAAAGAAQFLAPYAAASRAAGVPLKVGEGNSVSCGGRAGVSDVFGAALWALDSLLQVAAVGVAQWNFHGSPSPRSHYTYIAFPQAPSTVPDVRPLFLGLWAATVATANASQLWSATANISNPLVKAHALKDARGVWRVVLVHKDLDATAPAEVTVRPAAGSGAAGASLLQLLAPGNNASATRGLTFMGFTFDGSQDGNPIVVGPPAEALPLVDGAFSFSLPPRSAAIIVYS